MTSRSFEPNGKTLSPPGRKLPARRSPLDTSSLPPHGTYWHGRRPRRAYVYCRLQPNDSWPPHLCPCRASCTGLRSSHHVLHHSQAYAVAEYTWTDVSVPLLTGSIRVSSIVRSACPMDVCTHACMHVYAHVCAHAHVYAHVCVHVYTHVHKRQSVEMNGNNLSSSRGMPPARSVLDS